MFGLGLFIIILVALMIAMISIGAFAIPVLGLALVILLLSLGILSLVFWIWMMVDCIRNENISGNERILWALLIFFTHWIGGLIYFCVSRARRRDGIVAAHMA